MSIKRLVPLNNLTIDTAPLAPRNGDMYLDTITERIQVYYNGVWRALAYLTDIDPGSLNVIDGGQYNTVLFDSIIDGEYYNSVPPTDILDSGSIA